MASLMRRMLWSPMSIQGTIFSTTYIPFGCRLPFRINFILFINEINFLWENRTKKSIRSVVAIVYDGDTTRREYFCLIYRSVLVHLITIASYGNFTIGFQKCDDLWSSQYIRNGSSLARSKDYIFYVFYQRAHSNQIECSKFICAINELVILIS